MGALGSRNLKSRVFALCLAVAGAASMAYYHVAVFMPRVVLAKSEAHLSGEYVFGNDFYPVWLTSRRWIHDRLNPYSPEITREIQIGILGRSLEAGSPTDAPRNYRAFAYPAYTNLLLWPVGELPFRTARIFWVALLAILLGAAVVVLTKALSWRLSWNSLVIALLFTLFSYQELEGLYAGQLGLAVGFLLAASLLALVRHRLVVSGMLMALAMIKPQMAFLTVLYLIFWTASDSRRLRFVLGFFGTMLLLIAASLAVWPRWIQSWMGVLAGYPRYSNAPLLIEVLAPGIGTTAGTLVIGILLAAAIALAWRGRTAAAGSEEFWLSTSILLAITTITLLPGQSLCDDVILLPAILFLASRFDRGTGSKVYRFLFAVAVAVLVWPWLSAAGLLMMRPFLSSGVFNSKAVFVLPVRTAAVFPFVVLAMLIVAMRGRLRSSSEIALRKL